MTLPALLEERVAALTRGRTVDWVLALAVAGVAGAYVRAIGFTPVDRVQGAVQKIYYLHPQAAIAAYTAIALLAAFSVLCLWFRDERLDHLAESSAEVALVFTSVVLVTGSIWARALWSVWWTWEARLVSSLVLFLVVAAYMGVRAAVTDQPARARYSALLAVFALILIPFIHLSVYFFRHLHPEPIMIAPRDPEYQLAPGMRASFFLSTLAFTLLCGALIRARFRLGVRRSALAVLEGGR